MSEEELQQKEHELIKEVSKLVRTFEEEVERKVTHLVLGEHSYGISYIKRTIAIHKDKQHEHR